MKSYANLVTAIIEKYRHYGAFFHHLNPMSRDDLWTTCGNFIFNSFPEIEPCVDRKISSRYSQKQMEVFIVTGFWGFLLTGLHDGQKLNQMETEAQALMKDLINSDIFADVK